MRTTLEIHDGSTPVHRSWHDLIGHVDVVLDASELVGRAGAAIAVRSVLATDLAWVTVTDVEDSYRACIPTDRLLAGGYLLLGSIDQPLADEAGGPFRLVVAEGSTLCWNVKHVASLRATAQREPDSVPENPLH